MRRAQTLHIREPLRWLLRCSHPAAVCPEGGGGPACSGARFRVRALFPGGQAVCVQRAVPGTLVILVGRNQRRHCSQASGAQVWWAMRGHQDLPSCRVGWGRPTRGESLCCSPVYFLLAVCLLCARTCFQALWVNGGLLYFFKQSLVFSKLYFCPVSDLSAEGVCILSDLLILSFLLFCLFVCFWFTCMTCVPFENCDGAEHPTPTLP